MRVLLVEDARVSAIEMMMKSEGFNTYFTDLGEEGVDLAGLYDYDLILLDHHLTDMSGLRVLQKIRAAAVHTPVIFLGGDADIETKVKVFTAGADDYLLKPFHKDELICRSQAVIRRAKGHAEPVIRIGNVGVNVSQKTATVGEEDLHLTTKEYSVLELMAVRKGMTITKEGFFNHLYGGPDEPEIKIIDVFICKLRKKLREAGSTARIETNWGKGYFMLDPA